MTEQPPPPLPATPEAMAQPTMAPETSPRGSKMLEVPQRQSLWAVAFLAFRTIRQVGFVQIALFFGFVVARLPSLFAFAALAAVLGLVLFTIAALQWWRYTFCITGGELVVQRGVLHRQTLSVPLGRVQSVSLEQKLLHRIVSLVQISVDTAGTETAEFVIDAVDRSLAQELQRIVANYRSTTAGETYETQASAAPPAPELVLLRHDAGRLIKVALTQTPFAGLVLVAPLFAVADQIGEYIPFDLPDIDGRTGRWWLAWVIPAVLTAGFVASIVLNLIRVLLAEWGLTLRSTEAGLRRDAGLLSTTSIAAPIPRVQMVGVRQGALERMVSLHTVRLETIGATNLVVPGCTPDQAAKLRTLALADSPGVDQLDQRVSPSEVFRSTRNTLVITALSTFGLAWLIGWWSVLPLLAVPVVWLITRRRVRLRRWGATTEALADRHEFVGWRRQELLIRKVNGVTVGQSLFERKRSLATVTVATAAGSMSIGMIPVEQARRLRDDLLFSVETDHRAWM